MKKNVVTKPFDRSKIPPKQNLFAMPFIWLGCYLITIKANLKIKKVRMKGLKPPFIVLGTHHSFTDFYVTPLALFPYRANYVSELEGFEAYGEWLYRQAGCLGTRKFVNDIALIKNIKNVINRKGILVLYPEARYANVGTNSKLEISVAKLIKMLKVPVVVINMKGNYLQSPIWNTKIRKQAKLETTITQVFSKIELERSSISEVYEKLQIHLAYDEYDWQFENKISITYDNRAEGLELVLYKCPICKKEFNMESNKANLICKNCKSTWFMSGFGKLELQNAKINSTNIYFSHIPNWYEWQREEVINEINNNDYYLNTEVRIESLPNAINFIDLGLGNLIHDKTGFFLTFKDYGETVEKTLTFKSNSMSSIHTEYNYRKKGQCVTLSTLDNTYFLFHVKDIKDVFNVTKIQFATEYLYTL